MRTSNLQIPTVENVDGKLAVKFSTKTYPEFLKDNTQTNLRSVDLGDGNYSYTVQRNIVFSTPKVEKSKVVNVDVKSKPVVEESNFQQKSEVKVEKPHQQDDILSQFKPRTSEVIDININLDAKIEDDYMPNFSESSNGIDKFKTKPKANTLQMDFITFAKMQEPEIKRSLIAMNRNKEIEVKCK